MKRWVYGSDLLLWGLVLSSWIAWLRPDRLAHAQSAEFFPSSPSPPAVMPSEPIRPMLDRTAPLVAANTRFGFKLFSHLLAQNADENVLISPASIAFALSMLYNGANGTTQKAMTSSLELQGLSLEDVNQANAALKASLEAADPAVKLVVANSLWGRADFIFKPDFLTRNQTFYGAEITSLDFNSPSATEQINNWVSRNTEGKIPTLVSRINPEDVLFLINAIYFKGKWAKPFDLQVTRDRPFYLLDGSTSMQPMMQQQGTYRYLETDQFQAVSLPYGNDRLSLYVFLPRTNGTLQAFYSALNAENWETWMLQFSRRSGHLQLPRFNVEYGIRLNDSLRALGMNAAFDAQQADFSGLSDMPTVISEVQHKTKIEVNEEGTEAAAATSVRVSLTSAMPTPPFQMTVDRPFFFAICDNQTKTVLFMGAVVDPGA